MQNLIAGLANLTQISQEEIESVMTDGAINEDLFLQLFLDRESQRVNSIIDSVKKAKADDRGRAKVEVLTELEKEVSTLYTIEKKPIKEQIELVYAKGKQEGEAIAKTAQADPQTLSKEQILALPIVQEALQVNGSDWQNKFNQVTKEFAEYKESEVKLSHDNKVKAMYREKFFALSPVLPQTDIEKERAANLFLNSLSSNDIGFDVDGKPFIKDEQGYQRRKANEMLFTIEDYIKEKYPFGFNEVKGNGVAGTVNGQGGATAQRIDFSRITTMAQAYKMMSEAKTTQEKDAWLKFINDTPLQ